MRTEDFLVVKEGNEDEGEDAPYLARRSYETEKRRENKICEDKGKRRAERKEKRLGEKECFEAKKRREKKKALVKERQKENLKGKGK